MAPEQRNSRPDGEGPHRAHRDDEGADRVARRIRVAVEGEKHEHGSVSEDGQRGGHAGDSCEFHRRCIMSVMADLFFGYHMPNYTSAGAKGGEIFDRFLEQATAAEAAGFDLVTVMDRALNVPRPVQPGGPKIMIGGGGEKRTLRILARHGDFGHLFGGPLDALKHKRDVFLAHCEAEGRDPSTVKLLMGSLAILVENTRDAKAQLERIPEERRPMVMVATPADVAERLQPYVDAGFGGFTLSNQTLPTKDAIALGGELIKLMSGARSAA